MKYKHIYRKDTYQHGLVDLEVTGNAVALMGPNGSGKSNLLMSLGENLTGEFHVEKERIPRWGAEEGIMRDTIALADGREFTIERRFPSGKTLLTVEGEEPIKKALKANARILELLGIEKKILQNVVLGCLNFI